MNIQQQIQNKIFSRNELIKQVEVWKSAKNKIVFTNGCFDIIHPGHVMYLIKAAELGNKLIIGLNTDSSVSRLKGPTRPVLQEKERALLLAAFQFIDAVCLFEEDTPYNLIKQIMPDVLVKGKDYKVEQIAGSDIVLQNGGKVETIDLVDGFSTTNLIDKIKKM
ncbi:MAG: D-glycero-beta-D-manno-heptose 1-phosphate adenylyltransferase [Bacteroidales bacterium]|nr:D-glycero-beta-D-manno-heptose 1-phosphate adenylyltransferase [Bacteroidales bacterium]